MSNISLFEQRLRDELCRLQANGNYRFLSETRQEGPFVVADGRKMYNLSSNDYLGLAADRGLRAEFLRMLTPDSAVFSSSSSRLLSGTFPSHLRLEHRLAELYGRESALVASCGYHINAGILPAIGHERMLVLADKWVHASLIDGIRLSSARCIRFRHNDYAHLERLLARYSGEYESILIATESIFSMDGDEADLPRLAGLKKKYPNVLLYVDEAHAFGLRGAHGLGCAEEQGCVGDIDFLVGTLGKALASAGAFVVCNRLVYEYLVNKMRTFIFTTALPPLQMDWTFFLLERLPSWDGRRARLRSMSDFLRSVLQQKGYECPSSSHILPVITGESRKAVELAAHLREKGFYVLPVRPPSVPEGTARVRISLTAALPDEAVEKLAELL
ncbi:MAG: aminotransferase class I/II-fold pyridoxal phosphate-dependent enzyme [Bacteroidaceae bacterium]|jgi:8-amino-7-oxononanoate synthase